MINNDSCTQATKNEIRIREMDQYIAAMGNRLAVIEDIINSEEARNRGDIMDSVSKIIEGDPDLNVPPLYQTISEMREYQLREIKRHDKLISILWGLAFSNIMTFVLVIIALVSP